MAIAGVLANGAASAWIVVDDDLLECPDADFQSIQEAVDASEPKDTIKICPGVYAEQIQISHSLTLVGDNAVIIRPSGVAANTTTVAGGSAAAIIVVDGDVDVTIQNVIVDGADNQLSDCSSFFAGIFYRNASGTVRDSVMRNMKFGPGLEGCQSGVGVFAQSAEGDGHLELRGNSIHDYQKGGVVANNAGRRLTAANNIVTGDGPTAFITQNGIQYGFGAVGSATGNVVTNHIYSPCTADSCSFIAIGILLEQTHLVGLAQNTVTNSQVGIWAVGDDLRVVGNNVSENRVYDGIVLEGNHNEASVNKITNSEESGVWIEGDENRVYGNRINDAYVGVWNYDGAGNSIEANEFFNALYEIVGDTGEDDESGDGGGGGSGEAVSGPSRPVRAPVGP